MPVSSGDLAITRVQVGSIQPHPKNPRMGNVDTIRESIRAHGLYRPIVVQQSTGYILAGNHTWQAATAEGLEEIDVVFVDVDHAEAIRILLVDNRASDLGSYDEQTLADLLNDLPDLEGTGYTPDDLTVLLDNLAESELAGAEDEHEKLTESFQILVTCDSEAHQADLLNKFTREGLMVRALIS